MEAKAMLLLTLLKRLEANRRPLPRDESQRVRVILRRLFLDRDVASHVAWIQRRPGEVENLNRREEYHV
jgi:hypothetical protein